MAGLNFDELESRIIQIHQNERNKLKECADDVCDDLQKKYCVKAVYGQELVPLVGVPGQFIPASDFN